MIYDSNTFLSQDQMTVNAQYILDFFLGCGLGFTKNSVCGMLGNMQTESTINFGIYQSLDSTSTTNGFGLVQWTPNTKYFDWANSNGYSDDHVNGELQRIIYEIGNNIQWIPSATYPMSFSDFIKSTDTPENLAYAWMYNYERPASLNQPNRQTQARNWYDSLNGSGGTITPPSSSKVKNVITMLLSGSLNGW